MGIGRTYKSVSVEPFYREGREDWVVRLDRAKTERFPNGILLGLPLGTKEAAEDFASDVDDYLDYCFGRII